VSAQVGAVLTGAQAGGEPGYNRCRHSVRRPGRGCPVRAGVAVACGSAAARL